MRIAMISEHASPLAAVGGADAGGQNVHVAQLAIELARRGEEVTVYTRRTAADQPARVPLEGAEVVHVDAGPAEPVPRDELLPFMSELAAGVADDWRSRGAPDLVHAHFWMSGLAALDASAAHLGRTGERVPVVQTFHALGTVKRRHQGAADTSPAERESLEPRVGRDADAIIATCEDEVDELEAMGIAREKTSVVPCGVDTTRFTLDGPRVRMTDASVIAVIGRLVPRKGADLVIQALARLGSVGGRAPELLIVGGPGGGDPSIYSDPEIARLAQVARDAGVGDRVRFTGQIPQRALPSVIRGVDAVVCTPWYEPFGIVPLEAMACGVPVVAAAVGGLRDTVVDGVTGMHVPPRDPEALAAALAELLPDQLRRARMGAAGRRRVEQGYTWPSVAQATAEVYRALTGAVPGAAEPAALARAAGGWPR
ncbi:glycosyltransferase [Gryllotalpicola ginsengisoli]|uniref:glycosyltransferase n=1 Tax=Gryllotalpicola ginsengisoli TaxID=444608 RepID=UPI00040A163D|nr:glycosyltransferase [Gryllotalpicola ginsengisoli]